MFHRTTRIIPLLVPLLFILLCAAPAKAGGGPEATEIRCSTTILYIFCARCGFPKVLSQIQTVGEYDENTKVCFPESRIQQDLENCSKTHNMPTADMAVIYRYYLNGYETRALRPKNCGASLAF